MAEEKTKFCKFCGAKIPEDAVVCTFCGRQVELLKHDNQNVVINNTNSNTNVNPVIPRGKRCNKFVSLVLAMLLGWLGAHKFYEGKILLGIIYMFTFGLFTIGIIIDVVVIFIRLTDGDTYYYV